FDPCFRYAAFEDSELAYRLRARGLTIHYCPDALAYHDHWMDVESFGRREYAVGQMAVVFYRKHPGLDDLVQVRWIGDWGDAGAGVAFRPEVAARHEALDRQTDDVLAAVAGSLEDLIQLETSLKPADGRALLPGGRLRPALHRLYWIIFDVQRTRGKVQEW